MTTRKTFRQIAETLALIANKTTRKEEAEKYAKIFAADNPRFDRGRFMAACGL